MTNQAGKKENSGKFLLNIDRIEDQAKKNYFSLFPDEKTIHKSLPNAFVMNKPMSNVGGDGYWLYQKHHFIFLAVFDCIGQGHLASMMVRIYASALQKLVVEYSIEFPASILQFIHREIQSKFKSKENIQLNTGADLGIIKIDTRKNTLEFAGARMDLYQVTNGKLNIIAGDKLQIGELFETKHEYNSVVIDFDPESDFYLMSDGVRNLIGGPNMKRLGIDNIKHMLENNHGLEMREQKYLISTFIDNWSGSNQRTDDILVIGFSR